MFKTPQGNRLHIGFFGRTNTGKSSLINLIAGQAVSITSKIPGTTTDVVEKAMELLPLGPILLLDTAGTDDESVLGQARFEKTIRALRRSDVGVLVTEPGMWGESEEKLLAHFRDHATPVIIVINKSDLGLPQPLKTELERKGYPVLLSSSLAVDSRNRFLIEFKGAIASLFPAEAISGPPLISDLVPVGGLVVLVVPIDLEAPKGRLILPQVQTIRNALDRNAAALVVKERELSEILTKLTAQPDLVVCDSQAVLKTTKEVAENIPCTTFSILFARAKGDLVELARGAAHLGRLKAGDSVLIVEGCTHHAVEDDIGRVKIPRWLKEYVKGDLSIETVSGRDFVEDLQRFRAIIHCGGCMMNRKEMQYRIRAACDADVAMTNYGVAISFLQGVIERTLLPFPEALDAFRRERDRLK